MEILVTGGFGNVGRSAVKACIAAGHNVTILESPQAMAKADAGFAQDASLPLEGLPGPFRRSEKARQCPEGPILLRKRPRRPHTPGGPDTPRGGPGRGKNLGSQRRRHEKPHRSLPFASQATPFRPGFQYRHLWGQAQKLLDTGGR
jgi:hypothetical protein